MEITGCSREAALAALEAAGDGGVALAVDFVLSSTFATDGCRGKHCPPLAVALSCRSAITKYKGKGQGTSTAVIKGVILKRPHHNTVSSAFMH